MKNPYLVGYLPFITVILFSFTFGIFTVSESMDLLKAIGVYNGLLEFLTEVELKFLLLVMFALLFFMLFSAFKLIGETIHELGMLFFSRDQDGKLIHAAREGYFIFFIGALASLFGVQSLTILVGILAITILVYFIFTVYKLSLFMSIGGVIGLIVFEIVVWTVLVLAIFYVVLKLYSSILATLPF